MSPHQSNDSQSGQALYPRNSKKGKSESFRRLFQGANWLFIFQSGCDRALAVADGSRVLQYDRSVETDVTDELNEGVCVME